MRAFFLLALALVAASAADAFTVRPGVASESWMKSIKDDTPLCDLVIPGTHDAAAYDAGTPVGREFILTQKSNITEQLTRGIRYVDYRVGICEATTDKLCMYHGQVYLKLNFDTALSMIKQFLVKYPSETVSMRLQHEHGGGLDDFQGFVERNVIQHDPALWYAGKATKPAAAVTLGDVRGKILLFWSSGVKTSAFGYDYDVINTRTFWEFNNINDMSDTFQRRAMGSNVPGWYENPTSGIVYFLGQHWLPPDAIDKTAREMLPRVTKIWAATPMKKGIISMDYPTDDLIGKFIAVSVDRFPRRLIRSASEVV